MLVSTVTLGVFLQDNGSCKPSDEDWAEAGVDWVWLKGKVHEDKNRPF